jgi:2-amino-4-hydroxy-6-hydroxymethyldihydropteridine diphosphokinase
LRRRAYIGLGANQGDPLATLHAAVASLSSLEQSQFVAVSPSYASTPIAAPGPDFVNAVLCIDTALEPYGLLLHLLELEMVFGRKRRGADAKKNAPRSVDLDLLLVGGLIMRSTPLTLPHPRMHERAFVLRPLLDLAPEIAVPGRGGARRLLEAVAEQRCERLPADGAGATITATPVAPPATATLDSDTTPVTAPAATPAANPDPAPAPTTAPGTPAVPGAAAAPEPGPAASPASPSPASAETIADPASDVAGSSGNR